ncbi:RNA-binding transcriptional accessory protein, partial [Enterobacter mori]
PESYDATYQLLSEIKMDTQDLGTERLKAALNQLDVVTMAEKLNIGQPTLEDIIQSLIAPNRDPRDEFETPILKSDVLSIEDLS